MLTGFMLVGHRHTQRGTDFFVRVGLCVSVAKSQKVLGYRFEWKEKYFMCVIFCHHVR